MVIDSESGADFAIDFIFVPEQVSEHQERPRPSIKFIGASDHELREFAHSYSPHSKLYDWHWIAVFDERNAHDNTVILHRYVPPQQIGGLGFPKNIKGKKWYCWRIYIKDLNELVGPIDYAPPESIWDAYFDRPEFVGDDGVFNLQQAADLIERKTQQLIDGTST